MKTEEKELWKATKNGKYPPGTTAQTLANLRNINGHSALHLAAANNTLPPNTTPTELAACINHKNHSALQYVFTNDNTTYAHNLSLHDLLTLCSPLGIPMLHFALSTHCISPEIRKQLTPEILRNCRDKTGRTALHIAPLALLPHGVTAQLLITTVDDQSTTAWHTQQANLLQQTADNLARGQFWANNPAEFGADIPTAHMAVKCLTTRFPALHTPATKWLKAVSKFQNNRQKKLGVATKKRNVPQIG